MSASAKSNAVLILGGTGKTGRRVARELAARGVPTRIASRASAVPFDWNDQGTWADAVKGVGSAYVAYSPDLAVPGAVGTVGEFAELAVKSGVRRLVLLSGRGEENAVHAEDAVRRSGAEWTVVRCAWFNQNFSEGFLLDAVRYGQIALPAGDVREPFLDVDDIADVAVLALTEATRAGELYELTGPRLLTFAEAAHEISRAAGREIGYLSVSVDEYAATLSAHGVPPEVVALLSHLLPEVLDGRNARLENGVQRALGRAPRDFADYARAAAANGVWTR
jgi:uncharacterized protein YbjT (DUF2867 family)